MQSSPDWGALFAKGRCKAVGVPWSESEMTAIYSLKIPFEFVRLGCMTQEQYLKMKKDGEVFEKKTGEKPLTLMKKEELVAKAIALGISFDEGVITRSDLINEIKSAQKLAQSNSESQLIGRLADEQ